MRGQWPVASEQSSLSFEQVGEKAGSATAALTSSGREEEQVDFSCIDCLFGRREMTGMSGDNESIDDH